MLKTVHGKTKHKIMMIVGTCCKPFQQSAENRVSIVNISKRRPILATSAYMLTTVHSQITTQKEKYKMTKQTNNLNWTLHVSKT